MPIHPSQQRQCQNWLKDNCVVGCENCFTSSVSLFENFKEWALTRQFPERCGTIKFLVQRLQTEGFRYSRETDETGKTVRGFWGITLKTGA